MQFSTSSIKIPLAVAAGLAAPIAAAGLLPGDDSTKAKSPGILSEGTVPTSEGYVSRTEALGSIAIGGGIGGVAGAFLVGAQMERSIPISSKSPGIGLIVGGATAAFVGTTLWHSIKN